MTTTLNVTDGTIIVDHEAGDVLVECSWGTSAAGFWLTTDQALELAAALTGSVLQAMRAEKPEGT